MSYTVKLRDGAIYSLTDTDAQSLKNTLANSKTSFMAELGNDTILSSQIVSIKKNSVTEPDLDNYPELPSGGICRGQYSIQREINNIAQAEGKHWPTLIIDKRWRESVRDNLWTLNNEWCDYIKGTCFCE